MGRGLLDIARRTYSVFRMPKTTVVIISVLLALYMIGLVVPQKAFLPSASAYEQWRTDYPVLSSVIEVLHLNDIYVAPVTILFLVLFFLNLLVVMAHRFPVVLRRMYLLRSPGGAPEAAFPPSTADAAVFDADAVPGTAGSIILPFLKKRLWTLVGGDGARTFLAVRNRYSPAGFLFFHASFLLCLVGGLLVMYTRFAGTLILTEGQDFSPDLAQFRSITRDPKLMKALPPFYLHLDKVTPRFDEGVGTDLDVDLTVTYQGKAEQVRVKVNQPVERGALSILSQGLGVSPLMVLRDRTGRERAGAYVTLNILEGGEDAFSFPDLPYTFSVRLFPDFFLQEGKPASRSRELRDPVMEVVVKKAEATVTTGLLPLQGRLAFEGLELSFEDTRYWIEFQVVREYGTWPLFAGFASGIVGLVMRLIFFQKKLRITVEERPGGSRISVDGTSEYYPYSFRTEREGLARALQQAIEHAASGEDRPVSDSAIP